MASTYMFIYIVPSCLTCSYPSTHLMVFVPTGIHKNKSTCSSWCFASKIYLFPQLCVYMSTDVPVQHTYLFILMLYTSIYVPENKFVYFNAFPLGYPATKTCFLTLLFLYMPIASITRAWLCLFIFILLFRLAAKIYPSTFLLFYMSTDISVHQYAYSV